MINDTACTISGGNGASGNGDISVKLPTVSASALKTSGLTAGDTPFSLVLGGGTNCTNGKTAALWVEIGSTPLDNSTGALINQESAGAKNVQVRLLNPAATANDRVINLRSNVSVAAGNTLLANNQPAATIAENKATLNYIAQYLSTGVATAGKVSTYLTYSMQYN